MAKRNKRGKQRQQQPASVDVNTQNIGDGANSQTARPSVDTKPITIDDLENSTCQAEFENKKEELLKQAADKIRDLKSEENAAKEAVEDGKKALDKLETRINALAQEKNELETKIKSIREEYEGTESRIRHANEEAESKRKAADAYADDVKRKADKDRIDKLDQAANEAHAIWQTKADELSNQIKEIANRESELQKERRQLEKDRLFFEDDKEAFNELKEAIQNKKSRYDAANPARIEALTTKLEDERSKYEMLKRQYHELREKYKSLQVLMDTIKTEIESPEKGVRIASMNEVVDEFRELSDKYERLVSVYERYPDDAAISVLEGKAKKTDELEEDKAVLIQERDKYREEIIAANNAKRELETVRQEVEATNALNEHLLKELESHKTALESRTGDTCPSLTKIDKETESDDFVEDISRKKHRAELKTLDEVVSHVKNFAGSRPVKEQLYYTDNDIRAFLAGMAVSRLIILQGMSGTGKSSLPRIFAEAISGFSRLIPVESSWRDRNELLGYYNDFNKKFNAKRFTMELYRSGKERCQPIPTFIVLDEMNLARIEYYFSDFLAILQNPDHSEWLIELVSSDMRTLPMELPKSVKEKMKRADPDIYTIWKKIERSRQGDLKTEISDEDKEALTEYLDKLGQLTGAKDLIDGRKIKVTDNIWFVGTANRDESTFEISDKVYDRAQVVSLNRKGVSEGNYTPVNAKFISVEKLESLFNDAISNNKYTKTVSERLDALDAVLMEKFDLSFGNRIVTQITDFVGVFTAAGGTLENALDYQISTKILRKAINSDDEDALLELSYAVSDYPETRRLLEKRLRELS